jgi:phenylalanyl-tRNA synthetase beta chain
MNLMVSFNWLKEYAKIDADAETFAAELSLRSMSVEEIIRTSEVYDRVVIGVVKELKAHPNADKLRIAMTDIGNEVVQIVCGGANLAEGQRVVVALPGAKVRWHGEGNLIELSEAKIRGEKSHGMICAPAEIGFEKVPCGDHDIWDISELSEADAGTPLVDAFGINDVLFDIEVTTNRPDSMNIVGLAREAGAALKLSFNFEAPKLPSSEGSHELKVENKAPELCTRYMAAVIDGVKVGPSPLWLQMRLLQSGHRPINNIVDITNYVLHEYGQPLHAFDADKLEGDVITIRQAEDGEKIEALDDNEYELDESNLVISDSKNPLAVAGVMGGKQSGTWSETTRIVLEAATFDALSVRRTARKLNLYSDSQSMFEKGLSTEMPPLALARAVELILEIAGGKLVGEVLDTKTEEYVPRSFTFNPERSNDIMGVELTESDQIDYLDRLGFDIKKEDDAYRAIVPFWRDHDIEHSVDLTEEVARLYGYHEIPSRLPEGKIPSVRTPHTLTVQSRLKSELRAAGYTEFFSLSMLSESDLTAYDIDPADAVKIYNPLSSELTHMRPSLIPSLLKGVEMNQASHKSQRVFELARVYHPKQNDLPDEHPALVIAHAGTTSEQDFRELKGVAAHILGLHGMSYELRRTKDNPHWHPTRSAELVVDGEVVGMLGQVADAYKEAFRLDVDVMALELRLHMLIDSMALTRRYQEDKPFPSVYRDIAIEVSKFTEFEALAGEIHKAHKAINHIDLKDFYTGEHVSEGNASVTLGLEFSSDEKTLTSEEVDGILELVRGLLAKSFNATIR